MKDDAIQKLLAEHIKAKHPGAAAEEIARKTLYFADALCKTRAPAEPTFSERKDASEFSTRQRKLMFNPKAYDFYEGWYGHAAQYDHHVSPIYVAWDSRVREVETGKEIRRCLPKRHDLSELRALCLTRTAPVLSTAYLFSCVPRVTKKLVTTHRFLRVETFETDGILEFQFGFSREPGKAAKHTRTYVDMDYMNDLKSIFTEDPHVLIRDGLWIFTRWVGVHLKEEGK